MRRLILAGVALLAIPALAFAGATATQGNKTLQVKVGLSPAKASKKKGQPRPVAAKYDYVSGTTDGSPIPDLRSVKVDMGGALFGFDAFPKCVESKAVADGAGACPAGSKVGQGKAVAELHLATTTDFTVNVELFNGASDLDQNGDPRAPVDALLVVTEVAGTKIVIPMEATDGNKAVILKNAEEDEDPSANRAYSIKEIHITVPQRRGKKGMPFLSAPRACKDGSWLASTTDDFYEGGPLTATHTIRCKKA